MAEVSPLEGLEQFVGMLAAVRAQLEGTSAQIAAASEEIQGGASEAEAALSAVGEILELGAQRLDSGQHEGAAAVKAWAEALTAGLGGPLADAETHFTETSERFESELSTAREALEHERTVWAEDLGELETTLESLEGEVGSLVVSTDDAFTGLETALSRTAETLSAAATEAQLEVQALSDLVAGDLLGIVGGGFQGLTVETADRLSPLEENPLGRLSQAALARLEESTESGQVFGHNAIERSADLLDGVMPHWEPGREAAAAAADHALADRGREIREEIEEVGSVLGQGVDVSAGYTPLLPQLAPVRDAVERINEMLDSMNPFA
jgi:ABC-type transporter Mla subunit MlaD